MDILFPVPSILCSSSSHPSYSSSVTIKPSIRIGKGMVRAPLYMPNTTMPQPFSVHLPRIKKHRLLLLQHQIFKVGSRRVRFDRYAVTWEIGVIKYKILISWLFLGFVEIVSLRFVNSWYLGCINYFRSFYMYPSKSTWWIISHSPFSLVNLPLHANSH